MPPPPPPPGDRFRDEGLRPPPPGVIKVSEMLPGERKEPGLEVEEEELADLISIWCCRCCWICWWRTVGDWVTGTRTGMASGTLEALPSGVWKNF